MNPPENDSNVGGESPKKKSLVSSSDSAAPSTEMSRQGFTRRKFIVRTGGATAFCMIAQPTWLAGQTYVPGMPCSVKKVWRGSGNQEIDYSTLKENMLQDIANAQSTIVSTYASMAAAEAGVTIQVAGQMIYNEIQTKLAEKLDLYCKKTNVNFSGVASQNGLKVASPAISGGGTTVKTTMDLTFNLWGLDSGGSLSVEFGVKDMGDTLYKCGFDSVNGPTEKDCACYGGSETIADYAQYYGNLTLSFSLLGTSLSITADDDDYTQVQVTVSAE